MVSKSLLLAALAGLAIDAGSSAQTTQLEFRRETGPVGRVHYDLATGRVTKLVRPSQVSAGTAAAGAALAGTQRASTNTFLNTLMSGFSATGTLGREFVDWATKSTGGPFATAIIFGYGTGKYDTSIGGPGASLDLNFYSGTTGFCSLGTQFATLSFTGLPGLTSTLGGSITPYFLVTAFLASGLHVPDGALGWGYTFLDSDGAGRANTGPLVTDFGTNTGWDDAFDSWAGIPASTSTCVGTFFFGGCSTGHVPPVPTGTPCGSFMLGLSEFAPVVTASCTARNTTNPNDLVMLTPPVIGGTYTALTTLPVAVYAFTAGPLPGLPLSGLVNGDLLCDPTVLFDGVRVTTTGSIHAPLPKDPGLEGITICVQAAELAGPSHFQLTNAHDCTIGG